MSTQDSAIASFHSFCTSVISFTESEWQEFEKHLVIKKLKKNQHFIKEGEICTRMAFVARGFTRLYFLIQGEEVTKDFCFENTFTGSTASFISREPSHFNVIAMEDTELVTIDYEGLMNLYDNYHCWSNFGRKLVEQFAIRKENREVSFLLYSPENRYQDMLVKYPSIIQRVPLKLIASFLGMTPETLSRVRKKLSTRQ